MTKAIAPLSESIIVAVSRLVDDAQTETRTPSHSDIQFLINNAGLASADPNQQGQTVGKAKRVRAVLSWAIEHDESKGGSMISALIAYIRGCGGFRAESPNYVGNDSIQTAIDAFKTEGFHLSVDGELHPKVLDNLSGHQLTEALESYVRRAKKGVMDAALLAGTGKDLLEATAAHILETKFGNYSPQGNFPTLLGQAFTALEMATPGDTCGTTPLERLDRALYDAGCAINTLRNKEGTGHGRPWTTSLSDENARTAVEMMGIIAEHMLNKLRVIN